MHVPRVAVRASIGAARGQKQLTKICARVQNNKYFRLRNRASGREIVDFCAERPPPTAEPIGKVGGRGPQPFPMGFAVGGGHLDPTNRRFPISGSEALLRNLQ